MLISFFIFYSSTGRRMKRGYITMSMESYSDVSSSKGTYKTHYISLYFFPKQQKSCYLINFCHISPTSRTKCYPTGCYTGQSSIHCKKSTKRFGSAGYGYTKGKYVLYLNIVSVSKNYFFHDTGR